MLHSFYNNVNAVISPNRDLITVDHANPRTDLNLLQDLRSSSGGKEVQTIIDQ